MFFQTFLFNRALASVNQTAAYFGTWTGFACSSSSLYSFKIAISARHCVNYKENENLKNELCIAK